MKNYLTYGLIIVSFAILSSCGKSSDPNLPENMSNDEYYLTVKIDGTEFTTSNSIVSFGADITGLYSITGTGIEDEDSFIVISLMSPTSVGTFTLTEENGFISYRNGASVWPANIADSPATITITENTSDYIKGTFSFTGSNPSDETMKVFTGGHFKAEKL